MDRALRVSLENDAILRQAVQWHLDLESPDVTMERIGEWERWLADDERHARAFDRIAALGPTLSGVRRAPLPSEAELAADAYDGSLSVSAWAWKKRNARAIDSAAASTSASVPSAPQWFVPSRRRPWLVAGLAVPLLIILAAILGVYPREVTLPGIASLQYVDTSAGETRRITLAEGSTITVGGRSSLWVALTPHARRVSLSRGEAFFQVVKDPQRPFTVHAGSTSVTAVGTAFNVRRAGQRIVVAVAEGIVDVAAPSLAANIAPAVPTDAGTMRAHSARLSAGHQLSVEPSGAPPLLVPVDANAVAGWRNGRLQYMNEPLASIVTDLGRYSVRGIEIADPRIGELRVTGTVFEHNIDLWLESLETMFPIRVVHEADGRIRLEPE